MAGRVVSPDEIRESRITAEWILDLYPTMDAFLLTTHLAALLEARHGRKEKIDWTDAITRVRAILSEKG